MPDCSARIRQAAQTRFKPDGATFISGSRNSGTSLHRIEQSEPHFALAASPRRVSSDWQTCQLLLLDSGERRLLACSVWQPAERRRCTTLTDRNAVGGKAAANYRLAACAPQNHAPRSCLFPPEPACELLQSKRAPRFPGEPLVSGGYNYVGTSSPPSWSGN